MATITIPKNLIKNDDLIVLPRKEYEKMKAQMIPVFYLKGKAAKDLDNLVKKGLKAYEKGEMIEADSLKKALSVYRAHGEKN